MTEKVKIPQEVADAIETLRGAEYSDYGVVKYVDDGGPIHIKHGSKLQEVLRRWVYENDGGNSDLILDALRIGYDIELKYKVGDWVANLDGSDFYPKGDIKAVEIALIEKGEYGRVYAHHGTDACWGTPFGNLRHATPEEIKAEQERQKWAEIEEGDVLLRLKSGQLAVFLGKDPQLQIVDVEIRNEAYETWDMDSCELYAKKVGEHNE